MKIDNLKISLQKKFTPSVMKIKNNKKKVKKIKDLQKINEENIDVLENDYKLNKPNIETELKNSKSNIEIELQNNSNIEQEINEGPLVKENYTIIDPRYDISISEIVVQNSQPLRSLNPLELKKVRRLNKEDIDIYKIHENLKEQEDRIFEQNVNVSVDQSPLPFMITDLLPHQFYGISWMQNRENSTINGGILADEMGLGKTLQMIGLILRDAVGTTSLIVVPSIALNQWIYEINRHCPNAFNINVYHGRMKNNAITIDKEKRNIIMTSYGTVESDYRRKIGVLHSINFKRIVLDEAHMIKDNKASTTKAIRMINSEKRWGMTGTPIQNRVNDLLSLIKYLKLDPHSYYFCKKCPCKSLYWLRNDENPNFSNNSKCVCGHASMSHFSWWNRKIANPIREFGQTDQNQKLFNDLHYIINKIILRRTKIQLEKSLGLPSKIVIVKRCLLSLQEKDFYKSLYSDTKSKFNSYAINGQVLNNYGHIFELLQKMRMAANHPYLTYKQSSLFKDVLICGFCHEEADDPIKSKCNHIFCRKEAEIFLQESNKCPVCRIPITIDLFSNEELNSNYVLSTENWQSSTKIETVVQMLHSFTSETRSPKTIIFSQFVNFLEILRWRLERAGFRCVKIYGSMNISQRQKAIEEFNQNPEISVFLISLKAGGVALNLTEAENVIIMDLWWNPAVEDQAMDRIHRIGQFRPIRIYKIVIEDSIESRVLILQKKKQALFDTAINNDFSALQRLTEEDLTFLFC